MPILLVGSFGGQAIGAPKIPLVWQGMFSEEERVCQIKDDDFTFILTLMANTVSLSADEGLHYDVNNCQVYRALYTSGEIDINFICAKGPWQYSRFNLKSEKEQIMFFADFEDKDGTTKEIRKELYHCAKNK